MTESIPGAIILLAALLGGKQWSWAVFASILLSWISTAYSTASMAFSLDKGSPCLPLPTGRRVHHHAHTLAHPLACAHVIRLIGSVRPLTCQTERELCGRCPGAHVIGSDIVSRKTTPGFYGFVPGDPKRQLAAKLFLFLVVLAIVSARTISIALLYILSPVWLAALLGGEFGLFFFYKIARGDFFCWVPGTGFVVSLLFRVVTKVRARSNQPEDYSKCML